jgi:hypothetical protein
MEENSKESQNSNNARDLKREDYFASNDEQEQNIL